MTVNFNSTIDYNKWRSLQQDPYITSPAYYQTYDNTNVAQTDSFELQGETCTDGKDDGKIGFFSAIGNAIKGIGKTAVNMVKGCFTGKDGKFSLGKTLLTAATAAVCVAFPAVGLVACGIGAVAGAVQIGKGVYNAATATTDAEAKLAWQDVGGGALKTGLSVAGAKASYSAVMKTSTAGVNGGSATSELAKDASIMSKAKALGKDMWSSTANRASAIKTAASNAFTSAKEAYNESDLGQARQALKEAKNSGDADAIANAEANLKNVKANLKEAGKNYLNEAKDNIKSSASELFNKAKANMNKAGVKAALSKLKGAPKAIAQKLSEGKATLDELVSQYGYNNVIEVLEIMGSIES